MKEEEKEKMKEEEKEKMKEEEKPKKKIPPPLIKEDPSTNFIGNR